MSHSISRVENDKQYSIISEKQLKEMLSNCDKLFIKPSVDTSSGQGVVGFKVDEYGVFREIGGERTFDTKFLKLYMEEHPDFILQEGLSQHPYISQFNPTSINTLRVATYRSVKDNQVHVTGIIMRIGKSGSSVDNSHAGGMTIGVSMDGTLGKFLVDQYGNRYESFNGINFKESTFKIPEFDKVIRFAIENGEKIHHHRLVAQDICLDASGTPKLVEFNIRGFSVWLFQFTCGPAFGPFAKEIIDYCATRKSEVCKVFVEPF